VPAATTLRNYIFPAWCVGAFHMILTINAIITLNNIKHLVFMVDRLCSEYQFRYYLNKLLVYRVTGRIS